jgi:hypothetical protein
VNVSEGAGRFDRHGCTGRISKSIEPFVHSLARPKGGHVLFRHQDVVARTGVSPRVRPALLGQENSEPAELHPIETRERLGNFAEYRVNDILDVDLIQMCIARDEPLHQFGLNQDNAPLAINGQTPRYHASISRR